MPSQINAAMINELLTDLGEERVKKLVQHYIEEAESILNEIFSTSETASDHSLISNIHKLAGSSAMFGAQGLASKLRELETLGKTEKEDQMRKEIPELRSIWKKTRIALETEIENLQHSS